MRGEEADTNVVLLSMALLSAAVTNLAPVVETVRFVLAVVTSGLVIGALGTKTPARAGGGSLE